ncbi:replication initiator [Streptomyces chartreusis]|uniref:replication initiator n=1 Tax=Streptomyces chartreusis TaxID=1969 RepID=UPI003D93B6A2
MRRTGGCSDPIRLTGGTKTIDPATKTVLHAYTTDTEPGGMLRVACGNRRASRCPACAWTYAGDTYHLIRAGLTGDPNKGTPETVRDHPRVFAASPPPRSAPSTTGPTQVAAAAGRCNPRTHPNSAPRSTPRPTTTRVRCCGTTTPRTCGVTSRSICAGRSPSGPD